jgi:hypothetical protein
MLPAAQQLSKEAVTRLLEHAGWQQHELIVAALRKLPNACELTSVDDNDDVVFIDL